MLIIENFYEKFNVIGNYSFARNRVQHLYIHSILIKCKKGFTKLHECGNGVITVLAWEMVIHN